MAKEKEQYFFVRNKLTGLISNVTHEMFLYRIGTAGQKVTITKYAKGPFGEKKAVRSDDYNYKGDPDYETATKAEYDAQQEILAAPFSAPDTVEVSQPVG